MTPISSDVLSHLLSLPDLTQIPQHAVSLMTQLVAEQLTRAGSPPITWISGPRVVSKAHNYGLLGYDDNDITQADRYTKWIDSTHLLRTQTTSLIVGALMDLAQKSCPHPVTLLAPGMVYRRDVRDRWHCGEPHQMDIWMLYPKDSWWDRTEALEGLINTIMGCLGVPYRLLDTQHSYTIGGKEIEAHWMGQWLEIGECGHIDPQLLDRMGINPSEWTGLAMGVGVDRMVMVTKQLPDIRLLRDPLPNIAQQMTNLLPWKEASRMPAAKRDLSLARDAPTTDEELTELVLQAAGTQAAWVEEVQVKSQTPVLELPLVAIERLGAQVQQYNILLEVVLRDVGGSIPRAAANEVLRRVYQSLHQGQSWTYCP